LYGNLPGMRREKTNGLSNVKIKETVKGKKQKGSKKQKRKKEELNPAS
jgi:hypothetical protein